MRTRSFALSSLTIHPPQRTRPWRTLITHHSLLITAFFAFCSLTVAATAAEVSTTAGANLKQVTIRKQSASTHGAVIGKTEETFLVEVITDTQGLKKGLAQRQSMPEGNGMLFILDAAQEHAFWMKGMKFPLDIIFIGKDRKITEILENLQPCEECPVYFPQARPAYALELNAGIARMHGISVGDTMVLGK